MFQINEVIQLESTLYRVLAFYQEDVVWIVIGENTALPSLVPVKELICAVDDGLLTRTKDPFAYLIRELPEEGSVARQKRDLHYQLIHPLVADPCFFLPTVRGAFIRKVVSEKRATKQTLYRLLRRYWQRGQTANALLPDYKRSGGKGKRRAVTEKKLGRPRKYQPGTGSVVDENTERLFSRVIEDYLLTKKTISIGYTHRKFKAIYKTHYPNVAESEIPTVWQMKHFYDREYGAVERIQKQVDEIAYNKDIRPLHGTASANVLGPGSKYEIDATIADIYLVSDSDRRNIVGRPIVYMVIDVFSRIVAGFYIGFENPSYVAAMQALVMAMTDKVEYCKRFGCEITYDDWPTVGLPDAILADRGELLGHQIETLEYGFSVRIENTPPYRGDAKGIVERSFKTIQAEFKPFAPGVVTGTTIKKQGGNDYRLDACLTIHEFTEIILASIMYRNRYHPLEKYDRSIDMPDDLPMTPLSIWNWGIQNRTGRLRAIEEESLRINLLPRVNASISPFGACVFGQYYTSKELVQSGWMHRGKKIKRPAPMPAAYDPCNAERIFLFPKRNSSDYWSCQLSERSRQFMGASFWDVWQVTARQKEAIAKSKLKAGDKREKLDSFIESKIGAAERAQPGSEEKSNAKRIREIRSNRSKAKDKERAAQAALQRKSENKDNAIVIPLSDQQCDYGYPDMVEELFDEDD